MDPGKLEREVAILQRCNSEAVALNRALEQPVQPPLRQGTAGLDAPAATSSAAPRLH